MRITTILMLLMAATLAGCVTAQEQRALDEAKCRSYGFNKKNDAFAACLQRIDLDRRAALRASTYDDFYGPFYYRPVIVRR
ncbi:hypothetical protein [Aminobacter sp. AP02]|uniref:hypothetical protein n=1 Tax=Aminobacter sp. AP02 TaxID=2135737 RepID=UPI000D6CF449|nr:hypothetical protein [Aminobacter sp. AP02]PWK68494.1 hypothetical protein C8K44_110171 [Aminobacter sp. AP02]